MSFFISLSHVAVEYESAAGPVFAGIDFAVSDGWTGIVGANGSGKSTLLKLITGEVTPTEGSAEVKGRVLLCPQEVDLPPAYAREFIDSYEREAVRFRRILDIEPEWLDRWDSLSMGERKRIQIGGALALRPDILAIDEPTNHLDGNAREALKRALREYAGIGLLVSHDRDLLDTLCRQCLVLRSGRGRLRSGGVSSVLETLEDEDDLLRRRQAHSRSEVKRAARELQRRKEKAQKAENSNSKRRLDPKDYDGKGMIDAARISGRSRRAADLVGAQARVVADRREELEAIDVAAAPKLGLKIPYGSWSNRNTLLELPAGTLELGGGRGVAYPELVIRPRDRIAMTGDNGAGKSTLLRFLIPRLAVDAGRVLDLPQEIGPEVQAEIRATLAGLGRDEFSKVMNVVASLGSEARRVLDTAKCSPGEWRKLFFGLGVLRQVQLIVLDEPTNHFDLPSIDCLAAALADCRTALLLVSHDRPFLARVCRDEWHIADGRLVRRPL